MSLLLRMNEITFSVREIFLYPFPNITDVENTTICSTDSNRKKERNDGSFFLAVTALQFLATVRDQKLFWSKF